MHRVWPSLQFSMDSYACEVNCRSNCSLSERANSVFEIALIIERQKHFPLGCHALNLVHLYHVLHAIIIASLPTVSGDRGVLPRQDGFACFKHKVSTFRTT